MVFEHIENLKRAYTDKLVIVDEDRPELGRFQGLTGTVRTVNMSGRALVEFDGNKNIGWFDIDVDYLKLVDKPVVAETPVASPAAKPVVEKKPAATAATADPSKLSVADMLAAARGESAGATAAAVTEQESAAPAADPQEAEEEPSAGTEDTAGESAGDVQALIDADDVDGMCSYCRQVDR